MSELYHIPVLLNASIDGLNIGKGGVFIDTTFGGGGHSREILNKMDASGKLLAFDQDKDTVANIPDDSRFIFAQSNFRYISNFVRYYNLYPVNGILADLGVSSHDFDEVERGFSFRFNGKLDMRMNQHASLTAETIVNHYDEEHLANVLYLYGELNQSRKIARAIIKKRENKAFNEIFELVDCVKPFCGKDGKKDLARIFQALRIEVNDEMGALKTMLLSSEKILVTGGRLSVITYHSLEDRLVKNFMKTGNFDGKQEKDFYGNLISPFCTIGKITIPDTEEIIRNPRSRSAKLRIAEKK